MKNIFDIAIIGGGASGLTAAIAAARLGADVIVLEKEARIAQKLRITGKGRCNLSNDSDISHYLNVIHPRPKFCYSMFNRFFVEDTLDFFRSMGIETKKERGRRIFPVSEKALDVVRAFVTECARLSVEIRTESCIRTIEKNQDHFYIRPQKGSDVSCQHVIIATGGKSYPMTGSTGDGYRLAKDLGHSISPTFPALAALDVKENLIADLQGLSLKNSEAALEINGKIIQTLFGELLFTHKGLSGPIILPMCRRVEETRIKKPNATIRIRIDLKPKLSLQQLDNRLQRELNEGGKKKLKTMLKNLLPSKLILPMCSSADLDPDKECSQITSIERQRLLELLKNFVFTVSQSDGWDHAVITAGGVNLKEINPTTLESKVMKNVYFAGEIMNLDAETGGYNLQIAWSTGYIAGTAAAKKI